MMKFLRDFFHLHRWIIVHQEECIGVFSSSNYFMANRKEAEGTMIIERCNCGKEGAYFEKHDGSRYTVSIHYAKRTMREESNQHVPSATTKRVPQSVLVNDV